LLRPDVALSVVDGAPPTNYLADANKAGYKYIEQEKAVLTARAHVVSSIRTTDAPISRFLKLYRVESKDQVGFIVCLASN
jgi:hypothetical protein